jgi:hypothetical protein
MATVYLSPIGNAQVVLASNALPANAGFINTYLAGTSTPQATYTTSAGNVANPTSIALSVAGLPPAEIWLLAGVAYKFIITDSLSNQIGPTYDNLYGINDPAGSGGATALPYTPPGASVVTTTIAGDLNGQLANVFRWFTVTQIADVTSGTHALDVSAAINAALASGIQTIYLPPYTYRCGAGVTVPAGVTLFSFGFTPTNPITAGTILQFDLSIAMCLTVGGASANNGSAGAWGFSVTRAAGAIPGGSIGVLVQNCYNPIVHDLNSFGHDILYKWLGSDTLGIGCDAIRLYGGHATDAHIVIDTWPELRISASRFGVDGGGDVNCNTYIRLQGGSTSNVSAGPNTIMFTDCQFNQGTNACAHFMEFVSQKPASISNITEFHINPGCHIESVSGAYFYSDATWSTITRLKSVEVAYNQIVPLFALNVATTLNELQFGDNFIAGSITIAPTNQFNDVSFVNNDIIGVTSITGVASSTLIMDSNTHGANFTTAGSFGGLTVIGPEFTAGVYTNTAIAGRADISLSQVNTWTPDLRFNNVSTGMTGTFDGRWQYAGREIIAPFRMTLTSTGSGSGAATLVGLPVAASSTSSLGATGGAVSIYNVNMAAMTSPILAEVASGLTIVNLYLQASTGIATMSNSNFTNTSIVYGTLRYPFAP